MRWVFLVFWSAIATQVSASEPGRIVIDKAMIREAPNAGAVTAGYLWIHNGSGSNDVLTGAITELASEVQIHEMHMADGVMSMREVEGGVMIPSGETVFLAPRGLHLMIMNTTVNMPAGTPVPITLTFQNSGPIPVEFIAQPLGVIMKAQ